MAGYSRTPLVKKLGFKPGFRVRISNAPPDYEDLVSPGPEDVRISTAIRKDVDLWHFFTRSESELRTALPRMKECIRQDGMIWVSWPKKSSGVSTDVTEDTIRKHALPLGLVDVKVCAVDDVWSGLKLVIRKELRQ